MTYAHKVCRVTLSGTMFGGAEVWSTGFWVGQEGADSAPPTQADVDLIAENFRQYFVHASSYVSNQYTFTMAKMQSIKAVDGKPMPEETVYASPANPRSGVQGTQRLPAQCSLVVSLLSDRPRGKASHGRMYLPGLGYNVGFDGKISSADRALILGRLTPFFQPMITEGYLDAGRLILAAKASGAGGLNPSQNDYVQKLRLGDVIDTQRRRRNGIAESYLEQIL